MLQCFAERPGEGREMGSGSSDAPGIANFGVYGLPIPLASK